MIVGVAFASNALFNFLVGLLVAKFLGPEEFGRFAIAWAAAVLINTAFFDWIRLSAVRFYSARARAERPVVRASLDASFAGASALLSLGVIAVALMGLKTPLSPALLAMAAATGLASGLYDLRTALARARFLDGPYVRIIIVKNVVGLVATVGGAMLFRSAPIALAGTCLSVATAMAISYRDLSDPQAQLGRAEASQGAVFFRYAAPFVVSSVLFQLIPLANRVVVGALLGYGEAGQFSLANDVGVRVLMAIGSAIDVMVFQLAVRAEDEGGAPAARAQLADNLALLLALLLPTVTGLWLCLPSVEAVIAPEAFRGPFQAYLAPMLPGLMAFAVMMFGVAPIFQIAKQTRPMITAALAALATDSVLIGWGPRDGTGLWFAQAQSASLIVGLATAFVYALRTRPQWPRARELLAILASTAVMAAAILPLRAHPPGIATLAAQAILGGAVYVAAAWLTNAARLRERVGRRRAAVPAASGT